VENRRHIQRMVVIWLVLSIIAVPAIVFGLGPHMPPGNVSQQASDQTETNTVLAAVLAPISLGVIVAFVYMLVTFRAGDGPIEDGPPLRGHSGTRNAWLSLTTFVVLVLAVYGTFELYRPDSGVAGAGGGQGATPIHDTASNQLVVQVIGQQWAFTYRFPQYGGVETNRLVIPEGRPVEFRVTSIDVIHSFWAYQLGVKADAVPGAVNIAFVKATHAETFDIRCAELCGLWHGHMTQVGRIVPEAAFRAWISKQHVPVALPPYHDVYFPDPQARAG
jgi:cytochrome c oxidase subunit II